MPLSASSLRKVWIATQMVLAAGLLLAGSVFALTAAAQVSPNRPSAQEPPPPTPVVFQNPIPSTQLAFLSSYVGRPARDIEKDKRFHTLMKAAVSRTEYHYGRDMPLTEAVENALDGSRLPVEVRDGRYVTVAGNQGDYLRGRGFLWFDLQRGIVLGGFYFEPTNGEPTPTLTIFSRQLNEKALVTSQLPPAFVQDLYLWIRVARVPRLSPRYFIPQNGKKYALIHDEDYCWHPDNAPALPQDVCERMNADAADADMNAAYFMMETGNAANATAWMLEPEQVAWLGFRERSCGIGPERWGCRIRMTRQRTWVLLGREPVPPRPMPPNPRTSNPSR